MGLREPELAVLRTWRAGLCSGPLLLPAAHCASGWVEAARWMLSMDLSSRRLQHHSLLLGECCRVMACRHCIMLNGWLPYGRSTSASHGQKECYSSAWLLLPFLFYVPVSASSSREHHSGGLWRGRLLCVTSPCTAPCYTMQPQHACGPCHAVMSGGASPLRETGSSAWGDRGCGLHCLQPGTAVLSATL